MTLSYGGDDATRPYIVAQRRREASPIGLASRLRWAQLSGRDPHHRGNSGRYYGKLHSGRSVVEGSHASAGDAPPQALPVAPKTPPVQLVQNAFPSSANTLAIMLRTPSDGGVPLGTIMTVGVSTFGTPPSAWEVLYELPTGTKNPISSPSLKMMENCPSVTDAEPLMCRVYGLFFFVSAYFGHHNQFA